MNGATKMSKADWYKWGGLSNPKLYRKMVGKSWQYWRLP